MKNSKRKLYKRRNSPKIQQAFLLMKTTSSAAETWLSASMNSSIE